jgi:type IV pilus assembly protein PilX
MHMKLNNTLSSPPRREQGAVLVVSLLLLLVLTALALTASQATRLQERMAGNARDLDLSFQAGEAALRVAETRIQKDLAPKGGAPYICSDITTCDAESRENATEYFDVQTPTWWDTNARALGETLDHVKLEPYYFTEVWADVPDTLTLGGSTQKSGTMYYVNTSRATGATNTAVTITEATYAVRY